MAQSKRLLYYGVKGRWRLNYNWDAITATSVVLVQACEWSMGDEGVVDPDSMNFDPRTGRTWLGDADVFVTNVGVHGAPRSEAGGVEFYLHSHPTTPLHVCVTITVLDDVPARGPDWQAIR